MKTLNIIKPIRTHLKHLARAVAGAVLLIGSAQAEEMIVNVQFMRNGNNGASMTDIQGPVASADTTPTWNQLKANQYINIGAGPYALVQADGTASGISLTLSGTRRADGWNPAVGEIPVFSGEAYMDGGAQTMTSLFSGLKTDGTKYALYAMNSQGSSSDGYFTVNGNTAGRIRMRGAASPARTFDGTTDWTSFGLKTNDLDEASTASTAHFAELTPDGSGNLSVVLSYANTHNFGEEPFLGVAGFQLVEGAPPTTTPVITAVGSPLAAMSTTYGTVSSETSFTVSGTDMLAGILVTPPPGFEVSQSSGSGFAGTTTVGAAGTIDSTTVYVCLAATAAVLGTYDSQDIVLSSAGTTSVNVTTAANGNTVSPKALTVTATGPAKEYGTTLVEGPSATDFTAGATEVGSEVVTSVTLTPDPAGASPTTAVGTGYVITPSAATGTGGFLASNYDITYTPYGGTVVKGTPTLSVTNSPVTYDGSPQAAVVSASVGGSVSDVKYNGLPDVPTAAGTYPVTADFAPSEPGNYISLDDAPAGNFVIVQQEIMMVNVQFFETSNSSPSMIDVQGPVASADNTPTWNQFTGYWERFWQHQNEFDAWVDDAPQALVQANGAAATGIMFQMTGNRRAGTWGFPNSGAGLKIFGGGAFIDNSSQSQTSVFSGLTVGEKYDLYVMNAAASEGDMRVTVNGTIAVRLRGCINGGGYWDNGQWIGWAFDGTTDWTNFITTTSNLEEASTANTAYFKDLTPDTDGKLTIVVNNANTHRSTDFSPIAVAGFQLVQVTEGGAGTAPSAPTISDITAGDGSLSVAFTAPASEGSSAITNYKYSTDNGSTFTAVSPDSTTSPIVISGLTNGTTYQVKILAVNSAGDGTPSDPVAGTPGTLYTIWADGSFTQPLTLKEMGDDQDGDFHTNLEEYAFGTPPTVSSSGPILYVPVEGDVGTVTTPGQPIIISNGAFYYTVFGRRVDYLAAGLTYQVQFSAGLDEWVNNEDGTAPPVKVATDGTIDAMQVVYPDEITTPSGTYTPKFSRVRVENPGG